MNEKICRLCLQTTIKNHQAIGETFLTSLETLKLNINLCKENVMCTECTDYLQVFTNFKSASFHMIDSHLIMMHNLNSLKTETKCSFCPKTGDIEDFVSLNETNKYEALVDMLKQHILDKNSNNTEELLTCEICLGTLQDVSSFISKCLEVEEKISKYMEIEGIDDKDQIELKDVQKFTLKSAVKSEINPIDVTDFGNGFDQIKKECTMTVKREVKHENDLIHQELIIKPECGDTNTEQNHDSTESADEPREITLTPPKKRTKKKHFDVNTKEMILSIYKHETQENPALIVAEVAKIVANRVGVCSRSVFNVVKEYKNTHAFSAPRTNENRKKSIDLLDDFGRNAIRQKVHQFFFRNEIPNIDKVLKEVNDDTDLPNFKRTTFYKILKKLNFKCQRRGRIGMVVDKHDIIVWRRDYLRKIKSYRNENRKIYYLDETWVDAGHTKSKLLVDNSLTSSSQAFLDGLSTGLKNPSGKGKKLIICNIGSEDGFVPDALWVFESKKTGDYNIEMNGASFENWFSNVLPRLEDNSVIVLDNAPYHSRKLEKIPTKASNQSEIQDWLRTKNIAFDDTFIKVELLPIVNEHKRLYDKYIIDEMAKTHNKTVLRIPPYHCELNPIELIWADIKDYVADKNTTFADVKNILYDAVTTITPEKWQKCIQHVQQIVEQKIWDLDEIMDVLIEPLIINVGNSSTSSESE